MPLGVLLALMSPFSSMDRIISEELEFGGFPSFLKDAAVFAGKIQSGDNLVKFEPLSGAENIGNRSMFITQSNDDYRIKIHHGNSMCEGAKANVKEGGFVECCNEFGPEGECSGGSVITPPGERKDERIFVLPG